MLELFFVDPCPSTSYVGHPTVSRNYHFVCGLSNPIENTVHMTVTLTYDCVVQRTLIYVFLMTEIDVAQAYAIFDELLKKTVVDCSYYLYHSYRFYYP
jgi:hypothetical protein